jgi:hypothetical protein
MCRLADLRGNIGLKFRAMRSLAALPPTLEFGRVGALGGIGRYLSDASGSSVQFFSVLPTA